MKRRLLALLLLLGLFQSQPGSAQNPFFSPPAEQEPARVAAPGPEARPFPPLVWLNGLQRDFRERLTAHARQIEAAPTGAAMLQFLALTFVYGIIHAVGPGHGKSIVCSYFLARRGTLRQALLFGNLITFMHVLSATVVVLSLGLLGKKTNIFAFQELEGGLQSFSYLLILLIGLLLFGKTVRDLLTPKGEAPPRCAGADKGSMGALSLSAGLIPCPGAALILLFSMSLDILWAGLAAMLVLGAGMGLTNSLMGVVTLGSRSAILSLSGTSPRGFRIAYSLLALGGSSLIVLLGLGLLLGS